MKFRTLFLLAITGVVIWLLSLDEEDFALIDEQTAEAEGK